MTEWVNPASAEMVNKARYPLTKLGDKRQVDSSHRQLKRLHQARKALKVIEAVKGTAGRWR